MHFAYTNPDGSVAVVHLAPKARRAGESEEDFIARHKAELIERARARADEMDALGMPGQAAAARAEADAIATTAVDKPAVPSRAYRYTWSLSGGRVQHDMAKARAAKLAEIRAERNKRLSESDALYMRAQDIGAQAEVGRLRELRQKLRDLPATVDLSGIEEADALAAWQPDWPA